ncbi:hypothetical protein Cgig2_017673 [Carnegiea gigantea]|uniref:Uncharacterized protein n=1 Tax=Carnegiea gigantea TaxID=171969 RepID=A0A9Q1JKV7_9CARY|nr:hypothetical protein Cgig2_017673 [Carnegiea gigantea]
MNLVMSQSIIYLTLRCYVFNCITSDAYKDLFNHLVISLNLNLAISNLNKEHLRQPIVILSLTVRKLRSAERKQHWVCKMFIEPYIEPNSSEIAKELIKIESTDCDLEDCRMEFEDSVRKDSNAEAWAFVESQAEGKEWNIVQYEQSAKTHEVETKNIGSSREESNTISFTSKIASVATNLAVTPMHVKVVSRGVELGCSSEMDLDKESPYYSPSLTSTTSMEGKKNMDPITSQISPTMDVDGALDVVFHLSKETNQMGLQRSLRLPHLAYKKFMHERAIGYYDN